MQEVIKNTEQLSGLVDIYAIPTVNIKKIENKTLTAYTSDNIFHFKAQMESILHSDKLQQKPQGSLNSPKVSFFIPGQSADTDKILLKMRVYKFAVVIRDQNGMYNIIGGQELGLNVEHEYVNSSNWTGSKGYTIEFSAELLSGMKPINYPFTFI